MINFLANLIRGKKEQPPGQSGYLSGSGTVFAPFSGNAYASDIYRAAVDAIARNAAKLKGSHVITTTTGRCKGNCGLDRLLHVRPNPYMNAFDVLYKMVTHYYLYNNAFALLMKDERGALSGIYPIKAASVEFMTDPAGTMFCKFLWGDGKNYVFPYSDVIHLRRNFNDNDLLGDPNTALIPALELAHTQNKGIMTAIQKGANIRGILKYEQMLAPEKQKEERERFMQDYLTMDNTGGVVVTDAKMTYTPITSRPYVIDTGQLNAAKAKIYEYLGVSENIVNSSYTEEQWAASYESVVEPIAVLLSLEFTEKIFTPREQSFGNSILFESNRLQFASTATKTALIKEVMPLGLLTVNQALEVLNLPGVPDGDKRLQTLNVVNADKADQYQLSK